MGNIENQGNLPPIPIFWHIFHCKKWLNLKVPKKPNYLVMFSILAIILWSQ